MNAGRGRPIGGGTSIPYYEIDTTANSAAASRIARGLSPDPVVMVGPTPATAVPKEWDGGSYGPREAANWPALLAQTPPTVVGALATIPKLCGTGKTEITWEGAWNAKQGSHIIEIVDAPLTLPADTASHDYLLCTLPAGMWQDGNAWRMRAVFASTGSGSGNVGIVLNSSPLTYGVSANANQPIDTILRRSGTGLIRESLFVAPNIYSNSQSMYSVDAASAVSVYARIQLGASTDVIALKRLTFTRF